MDQKKFSDYLKERYEQKIEWYDEKAVHNRRIYTQLQWAVIVLAALTPILIELKLDTLLGEGYGRVATVSSMAVAILTAALKTFKYQENWISYRTTCETLRKERHFYDAGIEAYQNAQDPEAAFVDRVESLISRENTMWISTNRTETKSIEGKSKT